VREDLGYPPLVTPTSQIVGTQSVLNVLTGERYKSVTTEVKHYLQGRYGEAPGTVNGQVRSIAIGNAEVITCRPADLLEAELEKLRAEIESVSKLEEDVLTYAMFPDIGRTFLQERAAGTLKPEQLLPPEAKDAAAAGARFAPNEFNITLHGETYNIRLTGSGHPGEAQRPFYVTVDGVSEEVLIETLGEVEVAGGATGGAKTQKSTATKSNGSKRPRPSHNGHVTTAMPGTIVDVLVKTGQKVNAGDPVLVIEAMKMENEIQASVPGTVIAVYVQKGDTVTPDEALVEIQPDA
jgi:pyruvate carboxylase subunit B